MLKHSGASANKVCCRNRHVSIDRQNAEVLHWSILWFYPAGTNTFLLKNPRMATKLDAGEEEPTTMTSCNKDTGGKRRLQKWTRGVWFCVGGGGHIQAWHPLYQ